MKLLIAEKPSLAKAIIACLPKPHTKQDGFYVCGDEYIVTWCVGHIITQANPEDYDTRFKKWEISDLPIIPSVWKMKVTNQKQLNVIKEHALNVKVTEIWNCCDVDRAGQNIFDEVIDFLEVGKLPAKRLLITDNNQVAVKKALNNLKDNKDYASLNDSELGRSRADWILGLNCTRLYTKLGQNSGYNSVLSVGRCQTPLLGIVVRRDHEISNFVAKPFYAVSANCTSTGKHFDAIWKPSNTNLSAFDEDKRMVDKSFAERTKERLNNSTGTISQVKKEAKNIQIPKPFSLPKLQIIAAKLYNFDASKTLEVAQSLYDTHKLITYPRGDCEYIPEEHFNHREDVIKTIKNQSANYSDEIKSADFRLKSPAWNDKKINAHHAIIPSPNKNKCQLNDDEQKIFNIIAKRYISQFYAVFKSEKTTITIKSGNELLEAKGTVIIDAGWKILYSKLDDEEESKDGQKLPTVKQGDQYKLAPVEIITKKTSPPKPFNKATIIEAMTGIARFVENPEVKKILNENDGIGTPATQGNIIKTLFDREFLEMKGKSIRSTDVGRSLIKALPDILTKPDLTAMWEKKLSEILDKKITLDSFLKQVIKFVEYQTEAGKKIKDLKIAGSVKPLPCPKCKKLIKKIKKKDKKDFFWVHVNEDDIEGCAKYLSDQNGKPVYKKQKTVKVLCPQCNKPVKSIKPMAMANEKQKDPFWVHVSAKDTDSCVKFLSDQKGEPVLEKPNKSKKTSPIKNPCPKCRKEIKRLKHADKEIFYWVHIATTNSKNFYKFIRDKDGKASAI